MTFCLYSTVQFADCSGLGGKWWFVSVSDYAQNLAVKFKFPRAGILMTLMVLLSSSSTAARSTAVVLSGILNVGWIIHLKIDCYKFYDLSGLQAAVVHKTFIYQYMNQTDPKFSG